MKNNVSANEIVNSLYAKIAHVVLVLFFLALVLSKSASTILMVMLYLISIYFLLKDRGLRSALLANSGQPLSGAFLIYLGVAIIGVIYSEDLTVAFKRVTTISNLFLVYFIIATVVDTLSAQGYEFDGSKHYLMTLLIGMAVLNILAYLKYFGLIGNAKYIIPLRPLNMHHIWFANLNAIVLYVSILLMYFDVKFRSKKYLVFLIMSIMLSMVSVLLSTSRTAWLGIIVTAFVITYLLLRNKRIFAKVAISIFIILILMYAVIPIVNERVDMAIMDIVKFMDGKVSTSVGARFVMWQVSLDMFRENPIFGVGTGDYLKVAQSYVDSGKYPWTASHYDQPHNIYFNVLSVNGLIGLASLVFIFFKILRYAIIKIKSEINAERLPGFITLAVCIHYMVSGMTESVLHIYVLMYVFSAIMGLSTRGRVAEKKQ